MIPESVLFLPHNEPDALFEGAVEVDSGVDDY